MLIGYIIERNWNDAKLYWAGRHWHPRHAQRYATRENAARALGRLRDVPGAINIVVAYQIRL